MEPSLTEAEQLQLSQPVLVREVLHSSDHLCGPPLDLLHIRPVLRAPELATALLVMSHENGVEGQIHLSTPAGPSSFDAAQDADNGILMTDKDEL